jgi:hypothetical protein
VFILCLLGEERMVKGQSKSERENRCHGSMVVLVV